MRCDDGEVGIDIAGGRVVRTYDVMAVLTAAELGATTVEPPVMDAPEGYEVRPWRAGDRMRPARLKGRSRKLSDLYTDARVPRSLRKAARVMVRREDGVIVWAEHLGFAHGESADPWAF